MRVFYCDHFEVVLPPKHRFPMHKYGLLRERLAGEGILREEDLAPATTAPLEDLFAVHDAGYVQGFLEGNLPRKVVQRIGFPWSEEMVMRSLGSVGSTLAAVDAALEDGLSGTWPGGRTTLIGTSARGTACSTTSPSRPGVSSTVGRCSAS